MIINENFLLEFDVEYGGFFSKEAMCNKDGDRLCFFQIKNGRVELMVYQKGSIGFNSLPTGSQRKSGIIQ
ncbi:hypothetical protein J2786_000523 [Chryseobacterium vietnamense]|uniref:Uncharacterized protein n=1 Tax=Chryseobacterium vietnamense TaxID=866785 RepID=A0ACC6J323_9FLAO|nr:hypothetical protein [Chryseobacterium vietnamense]